MGFLAVVVVNYMVSGTFNNNYKASCSSGYIKGKNKNKINHSHKNGLSDRFCCAESGREGGHSSLSQLCHYRKDEGAQQDLII